MPAAAAISDTVRTERRDGVLRLVLDRPRRGNALTPDLLASTNPKSSTGRLDIFTRVITNYTGEFDRVPAGYKGPLYAEISPLTFSVKVRIGTRLSQLRLRRGSPPSFETSMRRLHERTPLVAGSTTIVPIYHSDDYLVHRAMLSYTFDEKLTAQLNVQNFTNEKYYTSIRNNGWANPGEGRSWVLTLGYKL